MLPPSVTIKRGRNRWRCRAHTKSDSVKDQPRCRTPTGMFCTGISLQTLIGSEFRRPRRRRRRNGGPGSVLRSGREHRPMALQLPLELDSDSFQIIEGLVRMYFNTRTFSSSARTLRCLSPYCIASCANTAAEDEQHKASDQHNKWFHLGTPGALKHRAKGPLCPSNAASELNDTGVGSISQCRYKRGQSLAPKPVRESLARRSH